MFPNCFTFVLMNSILIPYKNCITYCYRNKTSASQTVPNGTPYLQQHPVPNGTLLPQMSSAERHSSPFQGCRPEALTTNKVTISMPPLLIISNLSITSPVSFDPHIFNGTINQQHTRIRKFHQYSPLVNS